MGEAQRRGDVDGDVGRTVRMERAVGTNDLGEAAAFDVLHDDVVRADFLAPVVDADDVRMVQVRRSLGLAADPLDERRVGRVLGEQHLDGDRPVEELVARQEHLGHATSRDASVELVSPAEDGPFGVGHETVRAAPEPARAA